MSAQQSAVEAQLLFTEDVCPQRKREVSISSVDSEPIKIRPRVEDERGDVQVSRSGSVSSSSAGGADADDRQRQHARVDVPFEVRDVELELPGNSDGATAEAQWDSLVPLHRVSEAPVAIVTTTPARSATCVAEVAQGTLAMDVGTRFCRGDGRSVGTLVSLLGPVHHPLYLISYPPASCHCKSSSDDSDLLAEGTPLHYDLAHQRVIFSPATQCDVTRGTDASYVNDDELPDNVRPDFSDDEAELQWKREYKTRKAADKDAESVSSEEEPLADIEWSRVDASCDEVAQGGADCGAALLIPPWTTR